MSDETKTEPVEAEVIEETRDLVRPSVPTTIEELAAHGAGVGIIEQRGQIIKTLRQLSLQLIMPSDVTLFKTPDGIITGFVGDSGCDRVKSIWGIQISNLGDMERIDDPETGEFAFRITGDGLCKLTGEAVDSMEGIRYSTEPYAQQKSAGIQRTVAVQKAARANLDGGITRELTGLKSVPVEEFQKAWEGTWKKWEMCNKGRGFGSAETRVGGADEKVGIDQADIPRCGFCKDQPQLVYRPAKGDRGAFWGCRNYAAHPKDKVYVDHAKLVTEIEKRKKTRESGDEG